MNHIIYDKSTRTFGIHSDRVRNTVIDRYKDKYGKDSDEYNDFKERKELLDELESREDEVYRPYGYAASPKRITDLARSTVGHKFLPQGIRRSEHICSPSSKNKALRKYYDDQRLNFQSDLWDKYDKSIDSINAKRSVIRNNKLYPISREFISILKDTIGDKLTEDPNISSVVENGGWMTDKSGRSGFVIPHVNINPNDGYSSAPHEYQHLKNLYLHENKSNKVNQKDFINKSRFLNNEVILDKDKINDYCQDLLGEELSANRGAVMNPYIESKYPGVTDLLSDLYEESNLNQASQSAYVGGYNPPSLRYNMEPEVFNNFKNYINKR